MKTNKGLHDAVTAYGVNQDKSLRGNTDIVGLHVRGKSFRPNCLPERVRISPRIGRFF